MQHRMYDEDKGGSHGEYESRTNGCHDDIDERCR